MNSGIQCLSNTKELAEYFLNNLYLKELNLENTFGTKGVLAKKFANLVKRLWFGEK